MSRIEAALAAYPPELRLIQIQETVQRELQIQRRQMRRRDLEELRRMDREADTITDPAVKQVFGERVQVLAGKYLEDEEVLAVANGLLGRLDMAAVQGKGSGQHVGQEKAPGAGALPPAAGDGATASIYSPPTIGAQQPSPPQKMSAAISSPHTSAAPAAAPPSGLKPPLAGDGRESGAPSPTRPRSSMQLPRSIIAAAGAAVLVLAFFIVRQRSGLSRPPTAARFTVRVHTSPPGATIRINHEVRGMSDLQIDLPEGNYQIEAQLDGYQIKTSSVEAKAGSPGSVDLTLEPAQPVVKLSSDTGAGKVQFDDQPAVDLEGAQWTLDNLPPGEHRLKFDGKQGSASFTFSSGTGTPPAVKGPIVANGLLAVVVGNLGSRVHVVLQRPRGQTQP